MDSILLIWLLLAGPLWAALGGYLVPRAYQQQGVEEPHARIAGMLGGFGLGILAVGYLWRRPVRFTRWGLLALAIVAIAVNFQMIPLIPQEALVAAWLILAGPLWAVIGAVIIPRRYRALGLDDTQTSMIGTLGGFAVGPYALAALWFDQPKITQPWTISMAGVGAWILYSVFAFANPENPCVVAPYHLTYITQQTLNGLTVGFIYALMAVGLTLIYSVQGIVSFAHGQFYMVGGYFSYYFLTIASDALSGLTGQEISVNPLWGIPVAGALTFFLGAVFERYFLRPMHSGRIERAGEYAILITFGFGFFLEYTTLAAVGPFSRRADSFLPDLRRITLGGLGFNGETVYGPFNLLADRTLTMVIGVVLIGFLFWFLQRTWSGRALRAVSMDKQAAAVTGVNPLRMNTMAFGLGTMLAGMSGAALIPIFSWVPWVGAEMAGRSYVIVVLGGLGSVPGALIGGLIVGVVEALGAGCFPDPSKGAAYKEAFGLVIFALVLLLRPTGLFGRRL